jgi:chemotaxis signal transduction protein
MSDAIQNAGNHDIAGREFLAFTLGKEEYGIDILKVQEIRGFEAVTRTANAPEFIKGVINLRGIIIPVVDMRIKFNLGEPIYDKLDADLAKAMMSINAVKGVEIGAGFASAALRGEDNADEIRMGNAGPRFLSNHAGGILGGISSGQDVVVRFAVKPTSSILTPRRTIDRHGNETEIVTKGRHDPCVGIRAVPISGQTGWGLDKLMQSIIDTDRVWNKRISTARLNRWLETQQIQHPPPAVSGRRIKLKYMTQVKARPPAFMISCTRSDALPESYTRYLINGLRADFDMPSVPIRIHFRSPENPFEGKKRRT